MLICAINCYKVKWAARVAVIFSFGKVLALLLIICFGVYFLAIGMFLLQFVFIAYIKPLFAGHVENFHNAFEDSRYSPGELALSFYQGFWAYSGWNYLNFLTEEMKNPGRSVLTYFIRDFYVI